MVGFVVGLVEPDHTGHITTVGWRPIIVGGDWQSALWPKLNEALDSAMCALSGWRCGRSILPHRNLYESLGYAVTQRLPKYYSNGGDGLLMLKSLD